MRQESRYYNEKIIMAIAMLSMSASLTFGQGFISASLTCLANSNGNGLVVTGGRICANAFQSATVGGFCVDVATILNGYTVMSVAAGLPSEVTSSGLNATNLSTANIPCETVTAAMTQFLVFGGGFVAESGSKTNYAGFCNVNKIVFGGGYNDQVHVKLEPSSTVQPANNTIVSQWTGACLYYGEPTPTTAK